MRVAEHLFHDQCMPLNTEFCGIPVREDVLFTNAKGEPSRSVRRDAEKTLTKLQEPIRKILQPGEVVLYIVKVQVPLGTLEQLTMSWLMMGLVRAVLVVTDRRLLHINVSRSGEWRGAVRVLPWGALQRAKVGFGLLSRTLKLWYENGSKEQYTRISGGDGKKLKLLLPILLESAKQSPSSANGFEALCPDCTQILTSRTYTCPHCGLAFRDESTLLKRSLLIPGGGYFYCRLTGHGVLAALAELLIFAYLLLVLYATFGATGQDRVELSEGLAVIVIYGIVLAIEKVVMIYHCTRFVREYIPIRDTTQQQGMTASAGQ